MMIERDLDAWDRDIETEFRRAVAATKTAGRRKQGRKLMGAPVAFWSDVCRLTEGRTALVVAMYIYRRTHVCRSQIVTLPTAELAELGIIRRRKNEALTKLEAAGLIRIERMAGGRSVRVTLTWKPS
jgi:hypothetical protein